MRVMVIVKGTPEVEAGGASDQPAGAMDRYNEDLVTAKLGRTAEARSELERAAAMTAARLVGRTRPISDTYKSATLPIMPAWRASLAVTIRPLVNRDRVRWQTAPDA